MKVTTKNEFKDAIEKALNENEDGQFHGQWIGPDGTVVDVMLSHDVSTLQVLLHLLFTKQISRGEYEKYARLPIRSENNMAKINDFIYGKGWLRGVKSSGKDYYVNGKAGHRPTPKQIQWLQNYGKENKRNVMLLPRGFTGYSGIEHIYNVDDILESKQIVTENVAGKVIINVDIQPEYEKYFSFEVRDWIKFLNQNYDDCQHMVFLYNGHETMGFINDGEYKMWLLEYGLEERIVDQAVFFDKGYAFFRSCMDKGIDTDDIIDLLKFMHTNQIHSSEDMTKDLWKEFILEKKHELDREEIVSFLENAEEIIHLPELMDVLKRFNGIVLTGGGISECLKEVEIALKVLGKNYEVLSEFTY